MNDQDQDQDRWEVLGCVAEAERKRIVTPAEAGGWNVRDPRSSRISSHHQTVEEAVVRAQEILLQAGGGQWILCNAAGHEVARVDVAPTWSNPWRVSVNLAESVEAAEESCLAERRSGWLKFRSGIMQLRRKTPSKGPE